MVILNVVIVIYLIVCAFAIGRIKDLIGAVILFSAYSLMMSVLWLILKTPDVAITEAAIGAGVTSILFFAVISKTKRYEK
ncbi:MAG: hydrogenase subunit MbhD domain-containing protein [Candidatus Izemoplasmatales bacterium]|nr:hydrogenase subunit MbhD domain-containing protein [Candidatus Izemoplasmatales bacterium]